MHAYCMCNFSFLWQSSFIIFDIILLPSLIQITIICLWNVSEFFGLKTGFLFVYNLVQFLGFSWIFVNMTVRLFIFGKGEKI